MITKLRRAWSRTGVLAREIVAKRVTIAAAAGTLAATAVDLDLVPSGVGETATRWVGKGLVAIGVLVGVFWARQGTTPADPALDPVSSNGKPLVEDHVPEHAALDDPPVPESAEQRRRWWAQKSTDEILAARQTLPDDDWTASILDGLLAERGPRPCAPG